MQNNILNVLIEDRILRQFRSWKFQLHCTTVSWSDRNSVHISKERKLSLGMFILSENQIKHSFRFLCLCLKLNFGLIMYGKLKRMFIVCFNKKILKHAKFHILHSRVLK